MTGETALILGCGYVGGRLARRLRELGLHVIGTTRGNPAGRELPPEVERRVFDAGNPAAASVLVAGSGAGSGAGSVAVCFYLIPPLRSGNGEFQTAAGAVLASLAAHGLLSCFVYVSSTSVYGDRNGARVDERTPPRPDTAIARARLREEEEVRAAGEADGVDTRIARVAGIYGPGRLMEHTLREGRYALLDGEEGWSNRIHVDDLVESLIAVWRRGVAGRTYNLADGQPHRSGDFARFVAERIGVELPTVSREEAERLFPPDRLARRLASRRVSNERLRSELGVRLRYPDFREGVLASLRSE